MMQMDERFKAPHLRGKLAEANLHIYQIAGPAGMHPRMIGELLRGRRPLTADVASRILRAIQEAQRLAEASAEETRTGE